LVIFGNIQVTFDLPLSASRSFRECRNELWDISAVKFTQVTNRWILGKMGVSRTHLGFLTVLAKMQTCVLGQYFTSPQENKYRQEGSTKCFCQHKLPDGPFELPSLLFNGNDLRAMIPNKLIRSGFNSILYPPLLYKNCVLQSYDKRAVKKLKIKKHIMFGMLLNEKRIEFLVNVMLILGNFFLLHKSKCMKTKKT